MFNTDNRIFVKKRRKVHVTVKNLTPKYLSPSIRVFSFSCVSASHILSNKIRTYNFIVYECNESVNG